MTGRGASSEWAAVSPLALFLVLFLRRNPSAIHMVSVEEGEGQSVMDEWPS
jgi:hypothetical protein